VRTGNEIAFFFFITFDCHLFCLVSYEMSAIKYVWKNDESTLKKSPSLKTLNAYLDRNHTTECPSTGSWRGKIVYFMFMIINVQYYRYLTIIISVKYRML